MANQLGESNIKRQIDLASYEWERGNAKQVGELGNKRQRNFVS